MTWPDRMADRVAFTEHRLAALRDMQPVVEHLYEMLTPSQKAIMDQGMGWRKRG